MARACPVSGLKAAIPVLVKGSAETARALYRGQFSFAGVTAEAGGASVFALPAPSQGWSDAMHGFEWLGHLAAQQGGLERAFARNLVMDWLACRRAGSSSRNVVARRLINSMKHAGFLVEGAGSAFERAFHGMLECDAERLLRAGKPGDDLLPAVALGLAANALRGADALEAPALARLERALEHSVLPDGTHISRAPAQHLGVLLDLLPLRLAMGARRSPIPQTINAAIERMIPMLRFFALGDGGLALFHGASQPMTAEVKAVLDQDTSFARPLGIARYGKYARLAHGRVSLVMDCGVGGASESAMAFEMSDGVHRLIVNCGSPANPSAAWALSASCSAAHSTVEFLDARPTAMGEGLHAASETGSMAGAARTFGALSHGRDVFLASDGGDLRGEDRFSFEGGARDTAFAIRFHLHPSVKATLARDASSVMLQLPDKAGWRFSARGAAMALEESVYLGSASGPRKTEQIVIRGNAAFIPHVKWALRRIEKREKTDAKKSDNPRLPF